MSSKADPGNQNLFENGGTTRVLWKPWGPTGKGPEPAPSETQQDIVDGFDRKSMKSELYSKERRVRSLPIPTTTY